MPLSLSVKACSTLAALAGLVRQLDQNQQAAGALDQGTHRTGIARAFDQVTFPVAGNWRSSISADARGC